MTDTPPARPPESPELPEDPRPLAVDVRGLVRELADREVLRDVTLEASAGETVAVIGPNGAGKTTLLRILAGLLRPGEGTVRVLGSELPSESWRIRGRVGYLAHESLCYRDLTARENLEFHARLHGLTPSSAASRIEWLLEMVGLSRRADTRVGDFSRGMVQRLAACRAVLADPELLLLDEPLAGLDPAAAGLVESLVGPRDGRTRVVVTHDLGAGVAGADRVLALDRRGAVAYLGAPDGAAAAAADLYGSATL